MSRFIIHKKIYGFNFYHIFLYTSIWGSLVPTALNDTKNNANFVGSVFDPIITSLIVKFNLCDYCKTNIWFLEYPLDLISLSLARMYSDWIYRKKNVILYYVFDQALICELVHWSQLRWEWFTSWWHCCSTPLGTLITFIFEL